MAVMSIGSARYAKLNPAQKVRLLEHDIYLMQAECQAVKDRENYMKGFTLQQGLDMAVIALNRFFGFGAQRCDRFIKAYSEVWTEYANDADLESATTYNKEKDEIGQIPVTIAHLDNALKQIYGDGNFLPFDERYSETEISNFIDGRRQKLVKELEEKKHGRTVEEPAGT